MERRERERRPKFRIDDVDAARFFPGLRRVDDDFDRGCVWGGADCKTRFKLVARHSHLIEGGDRLATPSSGRAAPAGSDPGMYAGDPNVLLAIDTFQRRSDLMTSSAVEHARMSAHSSAMACVARAAAFCFCAALSSGTAEAAGETSAISGPPVINPAFGARMPRKCNSVTHLPSEAEAAALAQCATESGGEAGAFRPMIYLWQNLHVQMGKSRPYAYNADSHSTGIDTASPVYPIRVTGDQLSCTGKPTCPTRHADKSEGTCYKTTFDDWQCHFSQVFGITNSEVELSAPTTY